MRSVLVALLWTGAMVPAVHAQTFDHAHAAWGALLSKHVVLIADGRASQVRYAAMQQDRSALKRYLDTLSAVREDEFKAWSKPQRMAFLINAYNAFTVELILAHYPVASIKDIGGLFDNRWKRKFFRLFGRESYLDEIEHEMLRRPGAYDEPRVHFAVNCASIGCPMLREEPYVAGRLDAQLEEQTRRFMADRSRNRYSTGARRLEVSEIFKWFKEDWTSGYRGFDGQHPPMRSREQFFARYATLLADRAEDRQRIAAAQVGIDFLDYDWSLNGAK